MKKIVSLLCIILVSFFLQAESKGRCREQAALAARLLIEDLGTRPGGARFGDVDFPVMEMGPEELLHIVLQRLSWVEEELRALKHK